MSSRPILRFLAVAGGTTLAITVAGAVVGAGVWPLIGRLAGTQHTARELAWAGARDLGFYSFIWAPAIGIVVATMREWRRRHPRG